MSMEDLFRSIQTAWAELLEKQAAIEEAERILGFRS